MKYLKDNINKILIKLGEEIEIFKSEIIKIIKKEEKERELIIKKMLSTPAINSSIFIE